MNLSNAGRTTPKVDGFIRKNKRWEQELTALRSIVLKTPLTEDVKWRVPCYTFDGHNVVFIGCMKDYCALSFVKGVLLKDAKKVLQSPGENTQSARLIRFTSLQDITRLASTLKAYIAEAIELEKSGAKVQFKTITEHKVPEELQAKLDEDPKLNAAFRALTPGRQRAYFIHVAGAKQSATRASRVAKCIPRILAGKGMDD